MPDALPPDATTDGPACSPLVEDMVTVTPPLNFFGSEGTPSGAFSVGSAAGDCQAGDGAGKTEGVVRLVLSAPQNVRVTASSTTFAVVLYLMPADCSSDLLCKRGGAPTGACAAGTSCAIVQQTALPAGTYFAVVDGGQGNQTFDIRVEIF